MLRELTTYVLTCTILTVLATIARLFTPMYICCPTVGWVPYLNWNASTAYGPLAAAAKTRCNITNVFTYNENNPVENPSACTISWTSTLFSWESSSARIFCISEWSDQTRAHYTHILTFLYAYTHLACICLFSYLMTQVDVPSSRYEVCLWVNNACWRKCTCTYTSVTQIYTIQKRTLIMVAKYYGSTSCNVLYTYLSG